MPLIARRIIATVVIAAGAGCSSNSGGTVPTPATTETLAKVAGDNETAAVSTTLPIAPSVRVTDQAGAGVPGIQITFAVVSGNGSIAGASQTTNSSGVATVGGWTLGAAAGTNTLSASASGATGSPVTFTATASAAPDLRGMYVITLAADIFGSAAGLRNQSALAVDGTDGMTLVADWSALEPGHGQYDFTRFDQWVGYAQSLGKKITLAIKAGGSTPPWLFLAYPAGGGAAALTDTISPHDGATNTCQVVTIAPPWDAAFLAQWDTLLINVAAHLRSQGSYGTITTVRLTGINRTSDELRLPAQNFATTGLNCVSDAITHWRVAGYTPARLLQGWDAITNSFRKSFPDKFFSVAIISNPPQIPFPPVDAQGNVIAGTLPDQNPPLIQLAAQKFPGHLLVQFNFLLPGTAANPFVISYAQSYGTMAGFQSNNYYSQSDSGTACGGTPASPTPCTLSLFQQLLDQGIYPLDPVGHTGTLRAQYIEVWPIDANAFPADIKKSHGEIFGP